ncbi:MAG: NUDIX hydrolase [Planctomycetota bacterium]
MSTTQREDILHRGAKFDFARVTMIGRGGSEITREVVRHPGAVCVCPLLETPEGPRVVLIRNTRFTIDETLLELPAGTLEAGEDPAVAATRELEEETGYRCEGVEPIGTFLTTPGMTDEVMHAFVATGLSHVGQRLEADERIEVELMATGRAIESVVSGEMRDAKSMLTLLLALHKGLLAGGGGA